MENDRSSINNYEIRLLFLPHNGMLSWNRLDWPIQ